MIENEPLRDCDFKLISTIWSKEIDLENNPDLTAKEFLDYLAKGELTNSEAIRRSRQKIQQDKSSLRGNNYKGRQKEKAIVRVRINEV